MGIIKREKRDTPFVVFDTTPLNDPNLSWKAKGILAYLLSKPADWQIYIKDLVKRSKDGKDSTSSGILELIEAGYITKEKTKNKENGQFDGWDYTVADFPMSGNPTTGNPQLLNKEESCNEHKLSLSEENEDSESDNFSEDEFDSRLGPDIGNYYSNCIGKAQSDILLYCSWNDNYDELIRATGYPIDKALFDIQLKSFIQKFKNFGQRQSSTFSEMKGYFVSWLQNGYEHHKKELAKRAWREISIQEIQNTLDRFLVTAKQTSETLTGKNRSEYIKLIKQLHGKAAFDIESNMKDFVARIRANHKTLAKRYENPFTAEHLVSLEFFYGTKAKKQLLHQKLGAVLQYKTEADSLYQAIKIQRV